MMIKSIFSNNKDYVYLMFAMALGQGGVIAFQFMAAAVLSNDDVAILRTSESYLSLALVGGAVGMPSLLIRDGVNDLNSNVAHSLQRTLPMLAATGLMASGLLILISRLIQEPYSTSLLFLAPAVAPAVLVRSFAGYMQGIGDYNGLFVLSVNIFCISAIYITCSVYFMGPEGWGPGRFAGEMSSLLLCLWYTRKLNYKFGLVRAIDTGVLLEGIRVAVSLFSRMAIASMPLVVLSFVGDTSKEVGYIAIATLVIALSRLLLGVMGNYYLRDISSARSIRRGDYKKYVIFGAAVASLLTALYATFVHAGIYGDVDSIIFVAMFCFGQILLSHSIISNSILLVQRQTGKIVIINLLVFMLSMGMSIVFRHDHILLVVTYLVAELLVAIFYMRAIRHEV